MYGTYYLISQFKIDTLSLTNRSILKLAIEHDLL